MEYGKNDLKSIKNLQKLILIFVFFMCIHNIFNPWDFFDDVKVLMLSIIYGFLIVSVFLGIAGARLAEKAINKYQENEKLYRRQMIVCYSLFAIVDVGILFWGITAFNYIWVTIGIVYTYFLVNDMIKKLSKGNADDIDNKNIKRKLILRMLPFVVNIISIPVYLILDKIFFVNIFGCGCNKGFNANDLKELVYNVLAVIMTVWAVGISKKFNKKSSRVIYCLAVLVFNLFVAYFVKVSFYWK